MHCVNKVQLRLTCKSSKGAYMTVNIIIHCVFEEGNKLMSACTGKGGGGLDVMNISKYL